MNYIDMEAHSKFAAKGKVVGNKFGGELHPMGIRWLDECSLHN